MYINPFKKHIIFLVIFSALVFAFIDFINISFFKIKFFTKFVVEFYLLIYNYKSYFLFSKQYKTTKYYSLRISSINLLSGGKIKTKFHQPSW